MAAGAVLAFTGVGQRFAGAMHGGRPAGFMTGDERGAALWHSTQVRSAIVPVIVRRLGSPAVPGDRQDLAGRWTLRRSRPEQAASAAVVEDQHSKHN